MILTLTQALRAGLVAARVRAVDLSLESLVTELQQNVETFGPDAAHWFRDVAEATAAYRDTLKTLLCERGDARLAIWLHPETLSERYCAECSELFGQCHVCGDTMRVADMSHRPVGATGEVIGHESCVYPSEDT